MKEFKTIYIEGQWVAPAHVRSVDVENPATESIAATIAVGGAEDVDRAVHAARRAFLLWQGTSRDERIAILERIIAEYQRRMGDLVEAVMTEMGAPKAFAEQAQVPIGLGHLSNALEALRSYRFEEMRGATKIVREPIGVCAFITPWNWPLNQIACKVAPALATGCTMILKPSEIAPLSAQIFAEIIDASAVPAGVFNMIQGTGLDVGVPLATHPDIDMISFTGSTRAGVEVARNAAPTVKRVHQELGGKSANIILDDERLADNVAAGVRQMMSNSGQSCNAPSRMLVPKARRTEALSAAAAAVETVTVGSPDEDVAIGPVASKAQWDKIQSLIGKGREEQSLLLAGGLGLPDGLENGYYVKPTIFADVQPDMTIAREEIFGPVLAIMTYDTIDEAIHIANDTEYGLAGYVNGADADMVRHVALQLRAGQISINGAFDLNAPFGGYKMSGNGREWGDLAFHEFLETKALMGFASA